MTTSTTFLPATRSRSLSFIAAVTIILLVETVALHLWLRVHHPGLAWTATMLSLLTLLWLGWIYRSQDRAGLQLEPGVWRIRAPGRFRCDVPVDCLKEVTCPDWRQLPAPDANWLNGASPLDPNLLLRFAAPLPVHLPLGFRRRVGAIGLHLSEPERARQAWHGLTAQAERRAT